MKWPDKKWPTEEAKQAVWNRVAPLHPVDRVDALREVSRWVSEAADGLDQVNERLGVPERDAGDQS